MERLTWGMIGCGEVTEVKNGPGLYLNENCRLMAVANRTYSKAVDWVKRHGAGTAYKTADELIADPNIKAVYIATTPDVREGLAVKCAEAGKHLYLDKPVAMTYSEGADIMEACRRNGVQAYVAHYRRALPQFRFARNIIKNGELGAVTGARISSVSKRAELTGWRADAAKSGGGHFFEADIHALDILDFMIGPYDAAQVEAAAFPDAPGVERNCAVLFRWKNGAVGSGMWCFDTDDTYDAIEIFCEKGRIKVSSEELTKPLEVIVNGKISYHTFEMPAHIGMPHEYLVAQAILSGRQDNDICSLENAMRSFVLTCRVKEMIN